jgi:phosphoenolpyruvate phosphomutase
MEEVAREIHDTETLVNVEDRVVPVAEIFRLQGADELLRAEQRYLHAKKHPLGAVVLAAARGTGLESVTGDRPKVMVPVGGKPLLRRLVDEFKSHGVNDITVVAGYKADAIDIGGVNVVLNREYESTGELASLYCAREQIGKDTVILYGDLLFRSYIVRDLLESPGNVTVAVDSTPPSDKAGSRDYAYCSSADDRSLFRQDVDLMYVSEDSNFERMKPCGRWIGMMRVCGVGREWLLDALEELHQRDDFNSLSMLNLLNHIIAAGRPVKVHYINGHWLDLNNIEDLDRAVDFAHGSVDAPPRGAVT